MNSQELCIEAVCRTSAQRNEIILALQGFCREWQQTAGTRNLLEVAAPVGLIIADIAESLGLTERDRLAILGEDLDSAISRLMDQQVHLKQ